jgi:hypothetical protein
MVNRHIFGDCGNVCVLDLRIVKIVEVIENGDVVPAREEFFDEMGADKTSATRDEYSHAARVDLQWPIAKCRLRA